MSNEQKTVDVITFKRTIKQHRDIMKLVDDCGSAAESGATTLARIIRHAPEYLEWQKQQSAQGKRRKARNE